MIPREVRLDGGEETVLENKGRMLEILPRFIPSVNSPSQGCWRIMSTKASTLEMCSVIAAVVICLAS